jgi:hypothetical protein
LIALLQRLFHRIPRAHVDVVETTGHRRWRSIKGESFEITQSYRLDGELHHILTDSAGDTRYLPDAYLKANLTPDDDQT